VETEGQAAVLRAKRCDKLQGYLYARPMAADALVAWARSPKAAQAGVIFDDAPGFTESA
jgi:EAL domain-containing protein (putative c-di-GMP-specific phosphodiesterase class I)